MKGRPESATSWRQRWLLVALGLVLVAAIELALRLAGFGGGPPLLLPAGREAPGSAAGLYQVNPALVEPFFARPGRRGETLLGGHRAELVRVPKPPGTLRVVLLGDSTAEGFPLPRNLTAASFLGATLGASAGGRPVEVLNLGVTAVASFPVREIGLAALRELEPDLLVVYSGHNEFFGAGGVASWQRMGSRLPVLRAVTVLRRSASFQAMSALLRRPRHDAGTVPAQLMEAMAAVDRVKPGGALHERAERLLVANVQALASAARRRGVPVVVSTLVSNERDLVPLASFEGELPGPSRARFRERLEEAVRRAEREPGEALAALRELEREAPRHAGAAFAVARALEGTGDAAGAAAAYRRARDLDAMPWRAPGRQNEALRRAAARAGAVVADAEASFAAAAAPRAPGWDLFFDHLHPNLRGQALLAETFRTTIVEHRLLPLPAGAVGLPGDWRRVARRLGANPLEHYALLGRMGAFFERGPLAANNGEAARHFKSAARRLASSFDGTERSGVELWRQASHRAGRFLPISWFGGLAALAAGEAERAVAYLGSAVAASPPLSEERAAAVLLESVALARSGAGVASARLGARLGEAEREASGEPPASAVRLRAHAGLLALAGLGRRAQALDAGTEALSAGLDPTASVYYEALPAAADILATGTPPVTATGAPDGGRPRSPRSDATCLLLSLAAHGRPGHGASVDLHAATHRLIEALDRLLALAESAEWLAGARISSLAGGPAINVKPAVARAEVELAIDAAWSAEAIRPGLVAELGREWTTATLAGASCGQGGE